jgi:hypothetical protein
MKKVINIAVIAAALTGAAVTAQAANIEINMYGASAQRDYWNAMAPDYLGVTKGCTTVQKAQLDSNNVVHKGSSCADGNVYYINYTSVASMEGVLAAIEQAPIDPALNDTCGGNNALREIADSLNCTFPTTGTGTCPATKVCRDITGGTSDVEASAFVQKTHGRKFGHKALSTTNPYVDNDLTISQPLDVSAFENFKPTIVPFAFYANNGLDASADMGNLSRTQAVNLFGRKIAKWNELSGFSSNKDVQLCYRHASSGTHATLDMVVFRDDTKSGVTPFVCPPASYPAIGSWSVTCDNGTPVDYVGATLPTSCDPADMLRNPCDVMGLNYEDATKVNLDGTTGKFNTKEETVTAPFAYYYQSSSSTKPGEAGMKECVETNGGRVLNPSALAIGYMDADTLEGSKMHRMKYQGVPAVDAKNMALGLTNDYINNGSYDFWSAQNVYVKRPVPTEVGDLMTYANGHIPSSKAGIWTTANDLKVTKTTDQSMPMND